MSHFVNLNTKPPHGSSVTAEDVLSGARDLMTEHGWQTGYYFEHDTREGVHGVMDGEYCGGRMCTEGAINAAAVMLIGDEWWTKGTAIREAYDVVHSVLGIPTYEEQRAADFNLADSRKPVTIASWNDRVCAGEIEAVTVLASAAIKARPDAA